MAIHYTGRTLPLKMRNVIQRERGLNHTTVLSMRCSGGCAHGKAFPFRRHIRLYLATAVDGSFNCKSNLFLIIHELAHLASSGGHNDRFYREAIRIAKREGVLREWLNWQGRNAKSAYRRLRRAA